MSELGNSMYLLLVATLKKVAGASNQFYKFFHVVGRVLDGVTSDIFRLRRESNIATASESSLLLHGADREMPRLEGEPWEVYRQRLMAKAIVAAQAGTAQGIVSLVKSFGYETVYIQPLYLTDPERWAEAIVWISGGNVVLDDRAIIQQEINRIKPGTNLIHLAHEQLYGGTVFLAHDAETYKIIDMRQVY